MSTIHGTITGATLVRAKGARKTYLLTVDFGAYTGSSDDADIADIGAAIAERVRNGKTNTLRSGVCVGSGRDANGVDVYTGALTASVDKLTCNLTDAAGAEIDAAASAGVEVVVVVDES